MSRVIRVQLLSSTPCGRWKPDPQLSKNVPNVASYRVSPAVREEEKHPGGTSPGALLPPPPALAHSRSLQ